MQRLPGILCKKKKRASANKTASGCTHSVWTWPSRKDKEALNQTAARWWWRRRRPAHLCPSVSSSSMGALMTFFFSVACSSIIRRAPSKSWGKSFLDTVSCISSRRVSIWVAWPENSSNATRTWPKAQRSSLLYCVGAILWKPEVYSQLFYFCRIEFQTFFIPHNMGWIYANIRKGYMYITIQKFRPTLFIFFHSHEIKAS